MNGVYSLLSITATTLRPDNWADAPLLPLSPGQLKQAVDISKEAEDCIREFSEGIIGLGGVLTTAGESGEISARDVSQIGRLLRISGETLVGLQYIQEEADHFIKESAQRSIRLETEEASS